MIHKYGASFPLKSEAKRRHVKPSDVLSINDALEKRWGFDAHVVGYAPREFVGEGCVRLNKEVVDNLESLAEPNVEIQLLICDCDDPIAHKTGDPARDGWRDEERRNSTGSPRSRRVSFGTKRRAAIA
ncbi:MAG: hypothetical protein QM756_12335 [Polyangiaceae bacterium]